MDPMIKIIRNALHPEHASLPQRDCRACKYAAIAAPRVLAAIEEERQQQNAQLAHILSDEMGSDILAINAAYDGLCRVPGCADITGAVVNIAAPDEDDRWVSFCIHHLVARQRHEYGL